MTEGDIIFVNVVVDLIRCYAKDNNADPSIIFDAISMAFKKIKETDNGDGDKTGII